MQLIIKLDCKRIEPDIYMQKLTHFTGSKICITKFAWGDLGASSAQLFGRGGDCPHRLESSPVGCVVIGGGIESTTYAPKFIVSCYFLLNCTKFCVVFSPVSLVSLNSIGKFYF